MKQTKDKAESDLVFFPHLFYISHPELSFPESGDNILADTVFYT
jgi:hypothetical protein